MNHDLIINQAIDQLFPNANLPSQSHVRHVLQDAIDAALYRPLKALTMAKPIVGAAVAASSNESRPKREKVYNLIVEALK